MVSSDVNIIRLLSVIIGQVVAVNLQAAPMGYKGSTMLMVDARPNFYDVSVNYALTPRDAVGIGKSYMRSDDYDQLKTVSLGYSYPGSSSSSPSGGHHHHVGGPPLPPVVTTSSAPVPLVGVYSAGASHELNELTYTRLLSRWNLPESQANIWFMGGVGEVLTQVKTPSGESTQIMVTPGLQVDYETTRVYFSGMARLYRADELNNDMVAFKAGFSLYETDYDETQPWIVFEARRMHAMFDKTEITPMLRLINKSYFVDVGINNYGDARVNFMMLF